MPGGGGALGFAAFAAVKFGGYTAAGELLNRRLSPNAPPRAVSIGVVRLAIGLVAGMSYGAFFAFLAPSNEAMARIVPLFFLALFPIRLLEWFILLKLFFRRETAGSPPWKWMVVGTAWSFVLDGLAVAAAFTIPGGLWIC